MIDTRKGERADKRPHYALCAVDASGSRQPSWTFCPRRLTQFINKVLIALTGWTRRDDGVSMATAPFRLRLILHHVTGDVLTEAKWKDFLQRKSDLGLNFLR